MRPFLRDFAFGSTGLEPSRRILSKDCWSWRNMTLNKRQFTILLLTANQLLQAAASCCYEMRNWFFAAEMLKSHLVANPASFGASIAQGHWNYRHIDVNWKYFNPMVCIRRYYSIFAISWACVTSFDWAKQADATCRSCFGRLRGCPGTRAKQLNGYRESAKQPYIVGRRYWQCRCFAQVLKQLLNTPDEHWS